MLPVTQGGQFFKRGITVRTQTEDDWSPLTNHSLSTACLEYQVSIPFSDSKLPKSHCHRLIAFYRRLNWQTQARTTESELFLFETKSRRDGRQREDRKETTTRRMFWHYVWGLISHLFWWKHQLLNLQWTNCKSSIKIIDMFSGSWLALSLRTSFSFCTSDCTSSQLLFFALIIVVVILVILLWNWLSQVFTHESDWNHDSKSLRKERRSVSELRHFFESFDFNSQSYFCAKTTEETWRRSFYFVRELKRQTKERVVVDF